MPKKTWAEIKALYCVQNEWNEKSYRERRRKQEL